MSPEARALASVQSTDTWKSWSDPATLKDPDLDVRLYIERRLQAAFLLGFQKGVECAADRVRDMALGKATD